MFNFVITEKEKNNPDAPFFPGAAIMILALFLFENEFLNIVAISFTALILNELIMVALEITIWYVLPLLCGAFNNGVPWQGMYT